MLICVENKTDELLDAVFDIEDVKQEQRDALKAEMHIAIARATRPKWKELPKVGRDPDVKNPVRFLKKVHAADIHNGVVSTAVIRAIDPDLMDAVEQYISNRVSRLGRDNLGDAADLTLMLCRPPNARRQPIATNVY